MWVENKQDCQGRVSLNGSIHRRPRLCRHPRRLLEHVRQLQKRRLFKGAANHLQNSKLR